MMLLSYHVLAVLSSNVSSNSTQPELPDIVNKRCGVSDQSNQCEIKQGLVFLKEKEILLTVDTWKIVVAIGTEDYDQVIEQTELLFIYLESQSNITELIPSFELSRLKSNLNIIRQQVGNLKLLLPIHRSKRGLNVLNVKLAKSDNSRESSVYFEVDSNSKVIQSLTNALKDTVKEISNVTFSIWTEVQQLKRQLAYQAKISSLFREIELTINVVNKQLFQLQEALDVTSTGYLSSMLITPTKLHSILGEVIPKLPTGLSLIIDNEPDKMYHYYQLTKVHAMVVKKTIKLVIEIPLKSSNSYLALYSVKVLPYYNNEIKQFVVIQKEIDYLAISSDHQKYVLLSEDQVTKCVTLLPGIGLCPIHVPLMNAAESPNCIYSLFTGEDSSAKQLCQNNILTNFKTPILYPGPEGRFFIYSVPRAILVTLNCLASRNHLRRVQFETKTLRGTGVLYHTQNCYLYSKYFTVPPHISGQTSNNVQIHRTVVPSIPNFLSKTEINTSSVTFNTTSIADQLAEIQEIIKNRTAHADVITLAELQHQLEQIKLTARPSSHTSLSFISITIMVTAVVSVILLISLLQLCVRHFLIPNRHPRAIISTAARAETAVFYEEPQDNEEEETVTFLQGTL